MTQALCVFLFLLGMSWPTFAEDAKPLTTILLVARPGLPDSGFNNSVVLVMNNIGPAPAGVITNRPTRIAIARLFPELEPLAQLPDKVYFGGPVAIDSVSFLFRADTPLEDATEVLDGVYFSTNQELLRKLLRRGKPMNGLRVFIGHSGWAPGQLRGRDRARRLDPRARREGCEYFEGRSEHPWPEQQAPDGIHRS